MVVRTVPKRCIDRPTRGRVRRRRESTVFLTTALLYANSYAMGARGNYWASAEAHRGAMAIVRNSREHGPSDRERTTRWEPSPLHKP